MILSPPTRWQSEKSAQTRFNRSPRQVDPLTDANEEKRMPFDDIVKTWTQLEKNSEKDQATQKAYLSQLNVTAGAFNRAASRVDQAETHLAKLIAGYKLVVSELTALEKELESVIKQGEALGNMHVGLMKGGVLGPVGKYRELIAKNLASLLKEKRKL
jgi:hypothetical protein